MILQEHISGKNILFFSVQTFNLEKEITKKLRELGAIVDYYDERPSNNNFTKGIIRLKKSFYQRTIDKYYKGILKETVSKKYDFLFINKGELIPAFFLEEIKNQQPKCEFIFYIWDSFSNYPHPVTLLKYFDRKSTFDSADARNYNIGFRPLFYLDIYKKVKESDRKIKYDLIFLGTAHSDRYKISLRLVEWCRNNNLTSFCYYFMQSKAVYFFKKQFDKSFQEFDLKKLSFVSLNTEEIVNLYAESKVILDIHHPGQKGLTMRTFESIGAERKLITTNAEIIKYSFYNPNNICVINRDTLEIDKDFFQTNYEPLSEDLKKKMTMEGWLTDIFLSDNSNFWD